MNRSTVPLIPNIRENVNYFIRVSCIRPGPKSRVFPITMSHQANPRCLLVPEYLNNIWLMYSTPLHSFHKTVSGIPNTPNLHSQNLKLLPLLTQRLIPKRQAVTTNTLLKRVVQPQSIMPISTTNA